MTKEEHIRAGERVVILLRGAPQMQLNTSLSRNNKDIDVTGRVGFSFAVDGRASISKITVLRRLLASMLETRCLIEENIARIDEMIVVEGNNDSGNSG